MDVQSVASDAKTAATTSRNVSTRQRSMTQDSPIGSKPKRPSVPDDITTSAIKGTMCIYHEMRQSKPQAHKTERSSLNEKKVLGADEKPSASVRGE